MRAASGFMASAVTLVLGVLVALAAVAHGYNNGMGATPPMGWYASSF